MKGLMIMFAALVLFARRASTRSFINPIRMKKGDHVKLVITAIDHDHGFKLEAFHIEQLLKKGEATTVEFTADQAGTFPFACSHFCGMGHKKMKGELVVE